VAGLLTSVILFVDVKTTFGSLRVCNGCGSMQLEGPHITASGVLSENIKDDGISTASVVEGDKYSSMVGEKDYTVRKSTAAPVTSNNGVLE
jgi:hypothetical protein